MKNSAVAPVLSAASHEVIEYSIRELVPFLGHNYPFYVRESAFNDLCEVFDGLICKVGEENAHKLMRGYFDGYIRENNIREKAEADGCDVMEYLGLSESEVYALMGCEDEDEENC